ncbi:hypothetical protein GEMRC1_008878 [Eukaryota sp. GEM-RC1]
MEQKRKVLPYDLCKEMWGLVGKRRVFQRYDFEEVSSSDANNVFTHLREVCSSFPSSGLPIAPPLNLHLQKAGDWSYTDPIDGSTVHNQGLFFLFADGSRVVYRLSGTGSSGATIRMYLERNVEDSSLFDGDVSELLSEFVSWGLDICKMKEFTGRDKATVIT